MEVAIDVPIPMHIQATVSVLSRALGCFWWSHIKLGGKIVGSWEKVDGKD